MKKFIFTGIIAGLVTAFLAVSLYQFRAQEPELAKAEVASKISVAKKGYFAGSAKLVGGKADVKFKMDVATSAADIKVIVTPVGSWSGIYVMNVSPDGFTARAETGNPDAEFNWLAVSELAKPLPSMRK